MFRLLTASLALLAIACPACAVPVPQSPSLTIALKGQVRTPPPPKMHVDSNTKATVEANICAGVDVEANAEGNVEASADTNTYVDVEPQVATAPVATAPVALEGAAVVEFFGIPLEGAQDVVFVLDRSGSMEELALGQIANLASAQPHQPNVEPPLPTAAVGEPAPVDAQPLPPASSVPIEPAIEQTPAQSPRKIDVAHAELVDALQRLPSGTRTNVLFFNERLAAIQPSITALEERTRAHLIAFVWQTSPDGATALAPAMRTAYLMKARRIVLLSDGLGNVGGDAGSVLRDAREAMRGGVRIDTIGLGLDQDAWLLQSLADESGGIYQRL